MLFMHVRRVVSDTHADTGRREEEQRNRLMLMLEKGRRRATYLTCANRLYARKRKKMSNVSHVCQNNHAYMLCCEEKSSHVHSQTATHVCCVPECCVSKRKGNSNRYSEFTML